MFKRKGWCFYDKMKVLMPSKGKGSNVFRATALGTQDPSPPAGPSNPARELSGSSESGSDSVERNGLLDLLGGEESQPSQEDVEMHPPPQVPTSQPAVPALCPPPITPDDRPSSSTSFLSTPTALFPPSVPSSYSGSAASSVKPSSSISVRIERTNKRKAEDDDSSVISVASKSVVSTTASGGSSARKRRVAAVPAALDRVGDELSSLNSNFMRNNQIIERITPSSATQSTNAGSVSATVRKNQATTALLSLEDKNLKPEELVTIMDYFHFNVSYADAYLVLADAKVNTNPAIRRVWLAKRLEEAADVLKPK